MPPWLDRWTVEDIHVKCRHPNLIARDWQMLAQFYEEVLGCRRVLKQGGRKVGDATSAQVDGVGTPTFVYLADPEGNIIELQSWGRQTEPIACVGRLPPCRPMAEIRSRRRNSKDQWESRAESCI